MERLTKSGAIRQRDIDNLLKSSSENQFGANNAYYKLQQYEDLEEDVESVYGNCPGLLKKVSEVLKKHSVIDEKPVKSRLLTDEDVDKWLEYKQLEEQGRLLKLPCKVGNMLYYPEKPFNIVVPIRLNEIIVSFSGIDTYSYQYNCCSFDGCGDVFEDYEFDTNDIGKTVFLTKEEAEAKLKEMRG